jgi:hypothetical protein
VHRDRKCSNPVQIYLLFLFFLIRLSIFPIFILSFLIISLPLCYISFTFHYHVFLSPIVLLHTLIQGCTNPGRQIAVRCCLNFSVSSVLNLLHIFLLALRILRWFLDFREKNVCTAPYSIRIRSPVTFFISHFSYSVLCHSCF